MKKDQNTRARRASTVRSGGTFYVPPHPSGNGWVEGSRARISNFFMEFFLWKTPEVKCGGIYTRTFHSGMDAAALGAVKGTAGAENAKGVFYDN